MPPAYGRALSFAYKVAMRPRTGHIHPASPDAGGASSSNTARAALVAMIDLRTMASDASAPRGPGEVDLTLL
jgi:hypothetical protein